MLRVVQKYKAFLLFLFAASILAAAPTYAEDVDYNINIIPSINITIQEGDIVLNVNPSSQPFDSGSTRILVSTNSPAGYQLVMTADGSDLVKTDSEHIVIPTLPAHEGGYTESSFEANKWGYGIDGGNYMPFVSGTLIKETDTMANEDPTDCSVATKVDFTQADGTYRTTITFTAVAKIVFDYIQDITPSFCSTTPKTVVDIRDNEEYVIQQLADGNCWMLDNLRLDPTAVSLENLQGNTNASNEALAYLKQGGGTDQYATAAVASVSDWPAEEKYTEPVVNTERKNTVSNDATGNGSGKIGVYYNYCAASAGAYCYTNEAYNDNMGNIKDDICPKGWRLPTGYDGGEFKTLYDKYTGISAFNTAFSTPISGGATFTPDGGVANYWMSDSYGSEKTYVSVSSSSMLYEEGYYNPRATERYQGLSARCILKPMRTITFRTNNAESIEFNGQIYTDGQKTQVEAGTYPLVGHYGYRQAFESWNATAGNISNADYLDYNLNTYTVTDSATITLTGQTVTTSLQNVTSSMCTSTPMPAYDNRDNQVYWIARLNDGKCWMVDALRLGMVDLTTNLTSSNTNLPYTISASTFNSWRKTSGSASYTTPEYIPITAENARGWRPINEGSYTSTSELRLLNTDIDNVSGTKFGTLYNYCALTGGYYCYDNGSGPDNVTQDLCPKGWRLPIGNDSLDSSNELYNLFEGYESSYWKLDAPLGDGGAAIAWGGYFRDDVPAYQSINCGWSVCVTDYWGNGRGFRITDPNFDTEPTWNHDKAYGYPARCIANF